jgi:hypothetical protein
MLLDAAEETEAVAGQAAAAGGVVDGGCGGGCAGWEVGDGADALDGEIGVLEGGCQLERLSV